MLYMLSIKNTFDIVLFLICIGIPCLIIFLIWLLHKTGAINYNIFN